MKNVLNCWSKLDRSTRDLIISRFITHHNLVALAEDLKSMIQNLDDTDMLDEIAHQIDHFHDSILKLVNICSPTNDTEN